jgi:hypothetical protein
MRRASGLRTATLALVALADFLFFKHPPGWTVGGYALALLIVLLLRFGDTLGRAKSATFIAAMAGLAAAMALEPGAIAFALTLVLLAGLPLLARRGWTSRGGEWIRRYASFALAGWLIVVRDARLTRRRTASDSGPSLARTLRAWIVPAILTLGFFLIFVAANPVLERLVDRLREEWDWIFTYIVRHLHADRIVFWLVTAAGVWTLLRGRARARKRRRPGPPLIDVNWDRRLSSDFAVRCLILFNLLFLAQSGMDAVYLFGGAQLPEGMTYARYAHRGAYPLVATALLAALFVLMAFRPGGPAESSATARRLVFAWLAQNVFLTFTAHWRLHLYVEVYTLTRLRVAAGIWMALVAGGLALICLRIVARRSNEWLVGANALMTLGVLYVCAFVPFNTVIADYNVAHCRELNGEGPELDLGYLELLGPGALPALNRYLDHQPADEKRRAAADLARRQGDRLGRLLSDWRGWTWRRGQWQTTGDGV